MRESLSLLLSAFLLVIIGSTQARKCSGRYMEMRGGNGFVTRGGCRGIDSQIQEEYWTTIGYDGNLRDGRTTDDFLVFPQNENNGHLQRNSFVGYWDEFENTNPITRSKYGDNVHYEAFGHAFIRPDGRVCGWFVGSHKEVVEVCGGFRVLSRSRTNPHEPIPFEWVQGEHYRNRDVLGFHHHKIGKYEANGDEVLFGDADVKGKKFNGVSISNEEKVEIDNPEIFHRKVWLLRKKFTRAQPQDGWVPINLSVPKPREDVHVYQDPFHEVRINRLRLYPYYDQYGRLSGSQADAHRPVYDASGRRISFDQYQSPKNNEISYNYQNYDSQQPPPQNHPGYDEWLRNQYRIRGLVPRGYENNWEPRIQQVGNDLQRDDTPSYVLQPFDSQNDNSENNRVRYEEDNRGRAAPNQGRSGNAESEEANYSASPNSGFIIIPRADQPLSEINASVNPDSGSIVIPRADQSLSEINASGGQGDDSEVTTQKLAQQENPHIRVIRFHPATSIRDKKGNLYERRVENGKVYYVDASGNAVKPKIDDSAIDMKIERILANRRREEEKLRQLVASSGSTEHGSHPISAAEMARQG